MTFVSHEALLMLQPDTMKHTTPPPLPPPPPPPPPARGGLSARGGCWEWDLKTNHFLCLFTVQAMQNGRCLVEARLCDCAGTGKCSLLEWLLRETEQVHGQIRRYTSPTEHPFFPDELPTPILPTLSYPQVFTQILLLSWVSSRTTRVLVVQH